MAMPHRRTNADKKHPLYWTWNSMFVRCYYPSHRDYSSYGGRGIRVSSLFFDFQEFVTILEHWVGPKPSQKYTLDRIDNDQGYYPSNLRWSSKSEQNLNRRNK